MLVDEVLKDFIAYRYIVLGLIMVFFAVLWPHGISGAIDKLWLQLEAMKRKKKIRLQASITQQSVDKDSQ